MHQAEAVRGVRAPIVVRPEPDVSIIVRLLFMIPAERVAAAFCGFRVEEYPPKEAPSLFNAGGGRALPLVRNNEHIKAGLADRAFVGGRKAYRRPLRNAAGSSAGFTERAQVA